MSIFKSLKGVQYRDVIVDVPFTFSEAQAVELILEVTSIPPGKINQLQKQAMINIEKAGGVAMPGNNSYTLEYNGLIFDALKDFVKGWKHIPAEGCPAIPFNQENLTELFSEEFSVWQKMTVATKYFNAMGASIVKAKTEAEAGNESLEGGS